MEPQQQLVCEGKWRIGRKIGSGSFGDVYLGVDTETGEEVAMKLESVTSRHLQLFFESCLYKVLLQDEDATGHRVLCAPSCLDSTARVLYMASAMQCTWQCFPASVEHVLEWTERCVGWQRLTHRIWGNLGTTAHIPKRRWFEFGSHHNTLVIDLLGPTLEDYRKRCGGKLSLKTVLMLADQMISRIDFVHSKHFVHRSIRPENFLMGLGDKATQARSSRRDDLEMLGYVLVYLLRGSLPWQEVDSPQARKVKAACPIQVLCRGLPAEFQTYSEYVRSLAYDKAPDYGYLRKLFKDAFTRAGYEYDNVYDWTTNNSPTTAKTPNSGHKDPSAEQSDVVRVTDVSSGPLEEKSTLTEQRDVLVTESEAEQFKND
eukprot:jgi/Chlat1/7158/Chrsp57S06831